MVRIFKGRWAARVTSLACSASPHPCVLAFVVLEEVLHRGGVDGEASEHTGFRIDLRRR